MSILAHRIYPAKSEFFTFDVWHDEKLVEYLNKEIDFNFSLNIYGTGIVDIPVELLEKIITLKRELELDEDTIAQIQLDISNGKSRIGEVVSYHCY